MLLLGEEGSRKFRGNMTSHLGVVVHERMVLARFIHQGLFGQGVEFRIVGTDLPGRGAKLLPDGSADLVLLEEGIRTMHTSGEDSHESTASFLYSRAEIVAWARSMVTWANPSPS